MSKKAKETMPAGGQIAEGVTISSGAATENSSSQIVVSGSERSGNLYQRLLSVMAEVEYIQKEAQKVDGKYRPVSWAAVIAKCRPVMLKYGVLILPGNHCDLRVRDVQTKNSSGFRAEVVLGFRCINADNPDEYFDFLLPGAAYDSLDKDVTKGVTITKKTAYLSTLALETGEGEESKYDYEPPTDDQKKAAAPVGAGAAIEELRQLARECNIDEAVIAQAYSVERLEDIPSGRFAEARQRLVTRREKLKAAGGSQVS